MPFFDVDMIYQFNYSFFMTKPFPPMDSPEVENDVVNSLENHLKCTGGFKRTRNPYRLVSPKEEFWRDFYSDAPEEIINPMVQDLMCLAKRPLIIFYSGGRIAQRIFDKLGPRNFFGNPELNTLRGLYGIPADTIWRDIAHAPKPDEVEKQIDILRKHRLA